MGTLFMALIVALCGGCKSNMKVLPPDKYMEVSVDGKVAYVKTLVEVEF